MRSLHLTALVLAAVALSAGPAPAQPASPSPAVTLGSEAEAKWTATTEEAASGPEHKEWLKKGAARTITGEVVDVSCWLQLGKRGPAHVACGTKCVTAGQPGGLLDDEGNLYILMPEQHHPRRDGQVSLRTWIAAHMGARATVSGVLTEERGQKALFVSAPPADATPLPETVPHTTPAGPTIPPVDGSPAPAASATAPTTSPLPSDSPSPRPELVPTDVAPSPR